MSHVTIKNLIKIEDSASDRTPELDGAHAVELAREGVPSPVIQTQLGHSYVSTTSVYLQRIE